MSRNPDAQEQKPERELRESIAVAKSALLTLLEEQQWNGHDYPHQPPEGSEKSVMFRACSAVDAAAGRLEEAAAALGESPGQESPQAGNGLDAVPDGASRMLRQLSDTARKLEEAREKMGPAEDREPLQTALIHVDAGLAWAHDALHMLAGHRHPSENSGA